MKVKDTKTPYEEIISLGGYTVVFRYAEESRPDILENIRDTLFNQKITLTKEPDFCNQTENVR